MPFSSSPSLTCAASVKTFFHSSASALPGATAMRPGGVDAEESAVFAARQAVGQGVAVGVGPPPRCRPARGLRGRGRWRSARCRRRRSSGRWGLVGVGGVWWGRRRRDDDGSCPSLSRTPTRWSGRWGYLRSVLAVTACRMAAGPVATPVTVKALSVSQSVGGERVRGRGDRGLARRVARGRDRDVRARPGGKHHGVGDRRTLRHAEASRSHRHAGDVLFCQPPSRSEHG